MSEPTAAQLIEGSLEFLSDIEHWTQRTLIRDAVGMPVSNYADAAQACLIGSVYLTYWKLTGRDPGGREKGAVGAVKLIESCVNNTGYIAPSNFNDSLPHTKAGHSEVLSILACAKEKAHHE